MVHKLYSFELQILAIILEVVLRVVVKCIEVIVFELQNFVGLPLILNVVIHLLRIQ